MIVIISNLDKDAVQFTCALMEYKCTFYTKESMPGASTVEILDSAGNEITLEMAWNLGRHVEAKSIDLYIKKLD